MEKSAVFYVTNIHWIFCDVVCYPEKLFDYLQKWLCQPVNLVCTIKFQGKGGSDIIDRFASIKESQLLHLFHNKHELTWIRICKK